MLKRRGVVVAWLLAGLVWGVAFGIAIVVVVAAISFVRKPSDFGPVTELFQILFAGAVIGGIVAMLVGLIVGVVLKVSAGRLRVHEEGGVRRTQTYAAVTTGIVGVGVMALLMTGGSGWRAAQYIAIVVPSVAAVASVTQMAKRLPPVATPPMAASPSAAPTPAP